MVMYTECYILTPKISSAKILCASKMSFELFTATQATSPGERVSIIVLLYYLKVSMQELHVQVSWTPLTRLITVCKTMARSWPKFVFPFAGSSDFVAPGLSIGVLSYVPKLK